MKKALQKKLYALFLLITLCFTADHVFASHAMASDLTYKCLGGNTYQITLSFYRDCSGIPAPNNPVISITSASCAQNLMLTLSPIAGTGQDVTPTCSSTVTTCHGGTFTGVQQYVYTGIITLPMQCTDWTFSFSLCCRNAAITTISNPGTSTIYIAATLNNTISPGNNSPVFSSKPVPFVCVGQPFCFSQGATDVDGDSMAYELVTPLQNPNTTVNYIGGYDSIEPLNSSPPLSFDSLNGEICMTPQQLQVTVMAVLVKDYRNGVLIGTVERDMQIIVMNCNNNLPWLSGINGTNVFNMTVCASVPFCFNILSNDIDTGQTLTLAWNNGIKGATFTSAGNPHPTGTFCWTPADSQISSNPYCFTVLVKDNACPYNGSQVFTYCITVTGVHVDLGPDQAISCTDQATIYTTVNSPDSISYLWSTGATTTYITTGAGTYWCTVSNGVCTSTDTVVVTSPFVPIAKFTNTIPSCLNDTAVFTDHSTSFGSTIVGWTWTFSDGSPVSNLQNSTHVFPGSGTYYVKLLVLNSLGCMDSIVDTIAILPPPKAAFTYINSCQGQSVTFTDSSTGGATSWNWNFGDGNTSTSQNPTHIYTTPGSYTVTLIASNGIGCTDTLSQTITVYPKPTANFTTSPVCIGNSTTFNSTSSGAITSWHWIFGNGDFSLVQNPTYTYDSSGTYNVTLIVTTTNGCPDTITKTVTVNPLPVANAGPGIAICSGSSGILVASGGVTYIWTPGGSVGDTLVVNPLVNTSYIVTVTDANGCTASDSVIVVVNVLPDANAGPGITICKGSSGTLTGGGVGNYVWSPGGATTTTITVNPTVTTIYTITVTDSNGCSASDTATVFVHNPAVINLSYAPFCTGDSSTLTAGVTGVSYIWSTGDTTETITVAAGGNYKVTITDSLGCSAADSITVTINQLPVANAGPDKDICIGASATLTASGGGTYLWSNGATTNTITVNPIITTNYIVTVTNGNGCQASDTAIVNVHALPTADAGTDQTICSGSSATLTGSGGISYQWNPVGSANQTITVNPASNTTYYLTVTDAFGCSASDSINVTVNPVPVVKLSPALICSGVSPILDAGNSGSNYLWAPNGETTETISALSAETYSVTVINGMGCSTTAQTVVSTGGSVIANPVVVTMCQGHSSTIDAGNPGYSYIWSTGETTETISVTTGGTYSVVITSPGGCSATVVNTVNENPSPSVSFIAPPNCLGYSTQFTDQSSISSGNLISWNWTFGDGQTSNSQNPQHTYGAPGNYNATLIVSSNNGCVDTVSAQVGVNDLPSPGFTAPDVCFGMPTLFNNTSNIANGVVTSYSWNFGDGSTSALQQPSHQYSSNGSYTVTLIATSGSGCTQAAQSIVNVLAKPNASYTAQKVCQGSAINFTDHSSVQGGSISSWNWNFNDGASSASSSPSHIYATTGTYNVQLIVTSNDGCKDTVTNPAVIYPLPVANFSSVNECLNNQSTLSNLSSISSGNIISYFWSLGDGTTSLSTNPQHLYGSAGAFDVVLIAASDHGCIDTISHPVNVFPLPNVDFSGVDVCLADSIQFNNLTTVSGGAAFTSSWDFGDTTTSALTNPTHIFTTGGTYQVTLTATSANGCISSLTKPVNVYLPPAAAFSTGNNCFGIASVFHDESKSSGGSIVNWEWNFGDSTTGTGNNVTHTYSAVGQYNISLAVTTSHGCKSAVNNALAVYPLTSPAITAPNVCEGLRVSFINAGDTAGSPIVSSLWTFGDGSTSDSSGALHTYTGSGTYNVVLQTTNQFGCTKSVTTSVVIYPKPNTNFTAANECFGMPVTFGNTTSIKAGNIQTYNWNFGDSIGYSTLVNPKYTYPIQGTYSVLLKAVSDHGCVNSIVEPITMYPLPVVIFNNQKSGCSPVNANFADSSKINSGSIVGWLWDFGDGDVSTNQDPNHIYTNPGSYLITLTVSSDKGCVASATSTEYLTVLPSAKAEFTMSPTTIDIMNPLVTFTNLSTNYDSYIWSFGDGDTSNIFSPDHLYKGPGDYTIVLVVNNSYNCPDTAMRWMEVNPISTLYAPNAFTPNGDGTNDVWRPAYTDMSDIKVWIFNRWGEMLTKWDGLNGYWDGTFKGRPVQEDVYIYQIEGTGEDGKFYKWTGDITLIR